MSSLASVHAQELAPELAVDRAQPVLYEAIVIAKRIATRTALDVLEDDEGIHTPQEFTILFAKPMTLEQWLEQR